jgi:hypothetical protein
MIANNARRWLIISSLIITAALLIFFIIAPTSGYPIRYDQAIRLLEIVLPVFLGYLGSAARFIFPANSKTRSKENSDLHPLANIMVRGPVIVFSLAAVSALTAFGLSNRRDAAPGTGMDIDTLAGILSLALGLLAVTTNVAFAYLFPASNTEDQSASSSN